MKYCDKCKIKVKQNLSLCPLCQNLLIEQDNQYQHYFPIIKNNKDLHFTWKILIFLSFAISLICFLVNVTFPSHGWWSLFVMFGIICAWVVTFYAIKKRRNIVRAIFYQSIVISIVALIWDFLTKWRLWSINYVIPLLWIIAMTSMFILMNILHLKKEDTLYYFFINSILGILPIILLLTKVITFPYLSFICVILSILSLGYLIIFKGKEIQTEMQKRFHL